MKFISALLAFGVLGSPIPQQAPNAQNNTQLLIDAMTAQERSLRLSFRFLKRLARTYSDEIQKYSMPYSNITVFLPSDDAFLDIAVDDLFNATKVAEFVRYHGSPSFINSTSIPAGGWAIGRSFLQQQDMKVVKQQNGTVSIQSTAATNARILANATFGSVTVYFINQILNPPATVLDTVFQHSRFNFTSLLRSYLNANVTHSIVLNNSTVFVPSEEAIQTFASTCNASLSNAAIKSIVEYHVTQGRIYHSQFGEWNNKTIVMANGLNVTATYNGTLVPISNIATVNATNTTTLPLKYLENEFNATLTIGTSLATVIEKDILAHNAVLHIIDRVLVPANYTC